MISWQQRVQRLRRHAFWNGVLFLLLIEATFVASAVVMYGIILVWHSCGR
jgi:hypothetical protein